MPSGHKIVEQGARGFEMYLVHAGRARVVRQVGGQERKLGIAFAGDFFGEEAVLTGKPRSASVTAEVPVTLLVLPADNLKAIQQRIRSFKPTLEIAAATHRLARKLDPQWLEADEIVYFAARKHWVKLVQLLLPPIVTGVLPVFVVAWGLAAGAFWPIFFGGVLSLVVLGWMAWNTIDWTNDYYIVTNQRVVWLEKVIGLYDSRQEAPLSTLLSVGVETDLVGRLLDYGNVVVRTFVGQIRFTCVVHPNEAANLVSEQWERTKEVTSEAEKAAMRKALGEKFRANLGLEKPAETEPQPPTSEIKIAPSRQRVVFSLAGLLGGNLFRVRFEEGGTITYRKHWFVLLKRVFQPSIFLLAVIAWAVYRAVTMILSTGSLLRTTADGRTLPDTLLAALLLAMVPLAAWWLYQYLDWKNDIFQITPDQIFDIDKKPFGTEARRVALLDNVLSTHSSRIGLAGYVLNFGTVYITVGGSQLAFEDVKDPASVQGDIDRRRAARVEQKRQTEAQLERERMADWLISYHENAEDLERQQREAGSGGSKHD